MEHIKEVSAKAAWTPRRSQIGSDHCLPREGGFPLEQSRCRMQDGPTWQIAATRKLVVRFPPLACSLKRMRTPLRVMMGRPRLQQLERFQAFCDGNPHGSETVSNQSLKYPG